LFVNRVEELALLEKIYSSGQAECCLLSGRHRIGKTELLHQFCVNKKSVFYVCDLGSEIAARTALSLLVNQSLMDYEQLHAIYNSWEEIFLALGKAAKHERLVVVLDEFQNLVTTHPPVVSILQNIWDQHLKYTNIFLILSFSDFNMLDEIFQHNQAFFHSTQFHQVRLNPLKFIDAQSFFPAFYEQDQVRTYAVFGGNPAYLTLVDSNLSLQENIDHLLLQRGSPLYDEARYVLQQEIREPRNYFSILHSIASGHTRLNEIKLATGLEGAHVYLDYLQKLQLVERMVPLTEQQPLKSRKGIYRIQDPYLRFWFRFIYSNRTALERGARQPVLENIIMPDIDEYTNEAFTEICLQYFHASGHADRLPFVPKAIGKWWNNQKEIDLVVLGDSLAEIVDCVWGIQPVGTSKLVDLEKKASLIRADLPEFEIRYGLCSRSGFTRQLVDVAHQRSDVSLYPLKKILKM